MSRFFFLIATLLFSGVDFSVTDAATAGKSGTSIRVQTNQWIENNKGIHFIENKGQMTNIEGKPVNYLLFKVDAGGVDIYITKWGLSYVFIKAAGEEKEQETIGKEHMIGEQENENIQIEYCRADMELMDADIKEANIVKEYESNDYINYYLAHCPNGIINVRGYKKTIIKEIYPGIDWVIYISPLREGKSGFKYDFIVHPGADPSRIKLKYKWTDSPYKKEDGSLSISTQMGNIIEGSPYSYIQETNLQVQCAYKVDEETGEVHFITNKYNTDQTLVIDPQLQWGTYYGGSALDGTNSLALDASGNVFITGYVTSTNFPTFNPLGGAYFQGVMAGNYDAFFLKFSNSGSLLWATYYGGSAFDGGNSLAVDNFGNIFVTGMTNSPDFPVLNPLGGAYFQLASAGGMYDAFMLKLNPAGVLAWATCYGGSGLDMGYSLAIDVGGNVFVTGYTDSPDFPTLNPSGGAYFQAASAGSYDIFLLKFDSSGVLLWATYYGGSGTEIGYSLTLDASGNVFVTGYTDSPNFPTNPLGGAYFQAANAGSNDVFLLKLSNTGVPIWATYYGGSGIEVGCAITLDTSNNVFVTGYTDSPNFPTLNPSGGAYFQAANAGSNDVFLLKFNPAGILSWATYYGGSVGDYMSAGRGPHIIADGTGNVFVTGTTQSTDFPTFNPGGGTYFRGGLAGNRDVFLLKFSNTGVLRWATYNGTAAADIGAALAIDSNYCLFAAGEWIGAGSNGLMNPGGGAYYDAAFNGGSFLGDDSYIMKFCSAISILSTTAASTNILCNGACTGTGTAAPAGGTSPYTYSWNSTAAGQTAQTATGLCTGTYTVTVTDGLGSTAMATVTITQPPAITATVSSSSTSSCSGNNGSATATAGGGTPGYTYLWNSSPVQSVQTATGLGAGTYTATITDANGCTQTQTVAVTSDNVLSVTVSSIQTGCTVNNGTATVTPLNGTAPYTYSWNNGQTTQILIGLSADTYTVTVTDVNGCTQTQTITVTTVPGPTVTVTASPGIITAESNTTLTATGGGAYLWLPPTGLSCITCSNPIAFPVGTTMYCVLVTDTATGCSDSACVTVVVELDCSNAGELYLPNAFTPNNDGENDKLRIYYGNIKCIKTFKLVIYNRWGEKVFETINPAAEWDGTFKGKIEDTTVFVYYLETALINGEQISKKGNISLIK